MGSDRMQLISLVDLVSGHYSVSRNKPSPFQLNAFETLSYLPVASALVIGGLTLTSLSLNQVGRNAQQFVSSVLWAGMTAGVMAWSRQMEGSSVLGLAFVALYDRPQARFQHSSICLMNLYIVPILLM